MRFKSSFLKRTQYIRARIFDYPLAPLCSANANSANSVARSDFRIPPVVYQTWEENLFGRRHLRALERFREINGDLQFILMDRTQRDAYMAESWGHHPVHAIYRGAQFGPMRADIFRYCLLHERGGYYFDAGNMPNVYELERGWRFYDKKTREKIGKRIETYCKEQEVNEEMHNVEFYS